MELNISISAAKKTPAEKTKELNAKIKELDTKHQAKLKAITVPYEKARKDLVDQLANVASSAKVEKLLANKAKALEAVEKGLTKDELKTIKRWAKEELQQPDSCGFYTGEGDDDSNEQLVYKVAGLIEKLYPKITMKYTPEPLRATLEHVSWLYAPESKLGKALADVDVKSI